MSETRYVIYKAYKQSSSIYQNREFELEKVYEDESKAEDYMQDAFDVQTADDDDDIDSSEAEFEWESRERGQCCAVGCGDYTLLCSVVKLDEDQVFDFSNSSGISINDAEPRGFENFPTRLWG